MQLKPSEILYSQDSINIYLNSKSSHDGHKLGETLDDICEGNKPRRKVDDNEQPTSLGLKGARIAREVTYCTGQCRRKYSRSEAYYEKRWAVDYYPWIPRG
ncbi:hypothetical protein DPMN_111363 [Dreissena polymorpha]|uniref:Uncharacterized protein n=1 Tax=Dreissena polymorpha TaxID=45954 RepID=A0A9D4QNX7_DREPO|nr:hypothetical protein DPMN_111363 [Dreissena polymorpha]